LGLKLSLYIMEERDWYLKEIQKLAKLLAKLAKLRALGDTSKAFELINEAYRGMLDWNRETLLPLPEEALLQIIQAKALSPDQLTELAELLIQEGELLADKGDVEQSRQQFSKAIAVFNHQTATQRTYSLEREARIRQLQHRLEK
jgi:tetratricopeptide (TPR) repeat protein